MIETVADMNIVLVGYSGPTEELYDQCKERTGDGSSWFVGSPEQVFDIVEHNTVHLVLIEPRSYGNRRAALTALTLRSISPESVIGFLADDAEMSEFEKSCSATAATRLTHYIRVTRAGGGRYPDSASQDSFNQLLADSARMQSRYAQDSKYTTRYSYDVALSFAGEDRPFADDLAQRLKQSGIRVFYDDFERHQLWGTNLFEKLHEIYSSKARYCIMIVSKSYVEKQWTVHERRSAQERVLDERGGDYLLPVRIDDTVVPGLPKTIGYLSSELGAEGVARNFELKLMEALASRSTKGKPA
jgi:hypothetical protein